MELDDFRTAWQTLDRRLQLHQDLQLHLLRQTGAQRMKTGLRPLFWGQILQMLFGLCFVLLAVAFWGTKPTLPHLIVAGVLVHAYGVATIAMAGITLGRMRGIDYTAPVLAIQKQLAGLTVHYLRSGMVAGLPWWVLWVAVLIVLLGLVGVDLYARAPSVIWVALAIGIPGLVGTFWFHRWSRHPGREQLARKLDDSAAGGSLRRAKAELESLARFEQE